MKFKKPLALILAASLGFAAVGCGGNDGNASNDGFDLPSAAPSNTVQYDIPQDYYRTYYEVFVRSFADSDGDGVGDLRGLIDNLDYLNDGDDTTTTDLGINGIWMMPINPSPSYHKYDVIDYYDIDEEYGSLDDFDDLVEECDNRGIWLQMDLVLNHTSTEHKWFREAVKKAKQGADPTTDKDLLKYTIVKGKNAPAGKYYNVPGTSNYWYLGNFSSGMPDVNLKNDEVREEIKKIVDFWLERGIHSFRLDAVPWACEDSTMYSEANAEFWTWFNDYCNEKGRQVYGSDGDGIARYCYNVGEVWSDGGTITNFFGTGMSNFNYAMGGTPNVGFARVAKNPGKTGNGVALARELYNVQSAALEKDENAILSNFLSNHDNDRSSGFFMYKPEKIKAAAALYLLAPGNPYIYYGEEIGMAGSGSDNDPNKRLPFIWGDDRDGIENPPGANYSGKQRFGGAVKQSNDKNSILTYYRRAIRLRNIFPEIARGIIEPYYIDTDGKLIPRTVNTVNGTVEFVPDDASCVSANENNMYVAAYVLTYKDSSVLIVHNLGDKTVKLDLSGFDGIELKEAIKANGGKISFENGILSIASGISAVLK